MGSVYISPLNQFRFVPNKITKGSRYNTNIFDNVVFKEQFVEWQEKNCYYQKVQNSDNFNIILECDGYTPIDGIYKSIAILIDDSGREVKRTTFEAMTFTSNPDRYMGINSNTYFNGVQEGYYAIVLELLGFDEDDNRFYDYYYSEPIHVKTKHEGTLLLEYRNSYSKLGIPFDISANAKFWGGISIRVDGAMIDYTPLVERTVFIDQSMTPIPLKAIASRKWNIFFGGDAKLMPIWLVDKLNYIFTCSHINIDGKRYSPIDGASLSIEGSNVINKYGASIEVSEVSQDDLFLYQSANDSRIVILEFTESFYSPMLVLGIVMEAVGLPMFNMQQERAINDISGRASLVSYLNGRLGAWGGNFGIDGDILYYYNTNGNNISNKEVYVINNGLVIEMSYVNGEDSYIELSNQTQNSRVTAVVPMATMNPTVLHADLSSNNYTHELTSSGNYYAIAFSANRTSSIVVSGKQTKRVVAFGNFMDIASGITIYNPNSAYEFNQQDLKPKNVSTLSDISIYGTGDTSIGTFIPKDNGLPYSSMISLELSNTTMSVAKLDAFFNMLYNDSIAYQASHSTNLLRSGWLTIMLSGNLNNPSSASAVARTYLTTTLGINIQII